MPLYNKSTPHRPPTAVIHPKTSTVNGHLPLPQYRALRLYCAQNKTSVTQFVNAAVLKAMKENNVD